MECSCALNDAEMAARVEAWRALSAQRISRTVGSDKIVSVYPSDEDVLTRLRELIAAEAICCSFLKFEVREEPRHTIVELTFPEAARSLVETVVATPCTSVATPHVRRGLPSQPTVGG